MEYVPTVLRIDGYRFFFYSADRRNEPAHVHVQKGGYEAKFWLQPITLTSNDGFANHELNKIQKLLEDNQDNLVQKWYEFPNN